MPCMRRRKAALDKTNSAAETRILVDFLVALFVFPCFSLVLV